MKKIHVILLLLLLSSCTRYGDTGFTRSRRGNIRLYDGSRVSTKIIRNNVWSISSFLGGVLPSGRNDYEVYIVDMPLIELLSDEAFIEHVFDRIKSNKVYDEKEKEKAALLTTTDLRDLFENPGRLTDQSLYMLPVANIILLRNDENYGRRFFLYAYIPLLLCDNNPAYYLNESRSHEDHTDALIFKFMLTGLPSLYSRYFSKFPERSPSADLYRLLAEIDIEYLEDIYEMDLLRFKALDESRLANDPEAVIYYAYFFKYLFQTLEEETVLGMMESLFRSHEDRSADFRRVYREWKSRL